MRVGETPQFQTGMAYVDSFRRGVKTVPWWLGLIARGKTTHATVGGMLKIDSPPAMAGDREHVEVPPR